MTCTRPSSNVLAGAQGLGQLSLSSLFLSLSSLSLFLSLLVHVTGLW